MRPDGRRLRVLHTPPADAGGWTGATCLRHRPRRPDAAAARDPGDRRPDREDAVHPRGDTGWLPGAGRPAAGELDGLTHRDRCRGWRWQSQAAGDWFGPNQM